MANLENKILAFFQKLTNKHRINMQVEKKEKKNASKLI
jgi:hypothetical protein